MTSTIQPARAFMYKELTILLVDDSEIDLMLMRTAFKKAGFGCRLQEAHNGVEAIAYLKGEELYSDREAFPVPAFVLLDLNMPMKDGFEVLAWVRNQPQFRRLPVIVLTASTLPADVERAFELGANSFLVKPARIQDLVSMLGILREWVHLNHLLPLDSSLRG